MIPGRNVSDILEIVFKNYDKRIRPFYGGKYAFKIKMLLCRVHLFNAWLAPQASRIIRFLCSD